MSTIGKSIKSIEMESRLAVAGRAGVGDRDLLLMGLGFFLGQ